jgi:hypothetical protein
MVGSTGGRRKGEELSEKMAVKLASIGRRGRRGEVGVMLWVLGVWMV